MTEGSSVAAADATSSVGPSGRRRRWDGVVPFARDVARLLRDVAADDRVPRRAKLVAGAAAAYVLCPIDPVPDLVPVLGWIDDVLVVGWALRYLVNHAGYDRIREHWQGTEDGFALLLLLAGVGR